MMNKAVLFLCCSKEISPVQTDCGMFAAVTCCLQDFCKMSYGGPPVRLSWAWGAESDPNGLQ